MHLAEIRKGGGAEMTDKREVIKATIQQYNLLETQRHGDAETLYHQKWTIQKSQRLRVSIG